MMKVSVLVKKCRRCTIEYGADEAKFQAKVEYRLEDIERVAREANDKKLLWPILSVQIISIVIYFITIAGLF